MSVVETGNLTADPELRFTPSGVAVANFTIAQNRKRGDQDESHFFDVTVWKSLAENVATSLHKGDRAIVVGILKQDSWEDKDTGAKRSKVGITAFQAGPDLNWATATVSKNVKGAGPSGGSTNPDEDEDVPFS